MDSDLPVPPLPSPPRRPRPARPALSPRLPGVQAAAAAGGSPPLRVPRAAAPHRGESRAGRQRWGRPRAETPATRLRNPRAASRAQRSAQARRPGRTALPAGTAGSTEFPDTRSTPSGCARSAHLLQGNRHHARALPDSLKVPFSPYSSGRGPSCRLAGRPINPCIKVSNHCTPVSTGVLGGGVPCQPVERLEPRWRVPEPIIEISRVRQRGGGERFRPC